MAKTVNFPEWARKIVKKHLESEGRELPLDDIYIVWFCYILGDWKALVSTNVEDNRYYEVTHSSTRNQTYIDTYVKESNVVFGDEDDENKEK